MSLPTGKRKRARKFHVGFKEGDIASTTVHILQLLRKLRETERDSVIVDYIDVRLSIFFAHDRADKFWQGLSEREKDFLLLTILQCLTDFPLKLSSKTDDVTAVSLYISTFPNALDTTET